MPAAAPAVQASYMKNLFAALEARGQRAPLAAADPELIRAVADAPRMSWLPIALNLRTVEALAGSLGEERALRLLADCVHAQFGSPLWKGFIGGALRLLGTDPGSLGRWIPEAMGLVFRACGRFTAEPSGPAELSVCMHDLPPSLLAQRLWLRSLAIGMTPLFTVCGCDGSAQLVEVDDRARRARFRLCWKPVAS